MLNYTTTTFVNNTADVYANGTKKLFRIKNHIEFYNDGTTRKAVLVGLTAPRNAQLATARVILPSTSGTNKYRIAIYIRLRNNNNPAFSNIYNYKGRPIYVEFSEGETPSNVIDRVKEYMLSLYGEEVLTFSTGNYTQNEANAYNATLSGALAPDTTLDSTSAAAVNSALSLTGSDAYSNGDTLSEEDSIAYNATLTGSVSTSDSNPDALDITANTQWEMFMDQDNDSGVSLEKLNSDNIFVKDNTATITINNGYEAFGDYDHLIKDLRLPSKENTNYFGIAVGSGENSDIPIKGTMYKQYVIQYTTDRGVLQQSAVGGVGKSRTVHVFYVASSAVSDFETKLHTATITNSNTASASSAEIV